MSDHRLIAQPGVPNSACAWLERARQLTQATYTNTTTTNSTMKLDLVILPANQRRIVITRRCTRTFGNTVPMF